MFSFLVTKIISSVHIFFLFFLYFFNWFFYLFLFYLFILNSSLFCGDIIHGRGSYLLIMHSTLAIFTKMLWYSYIFFFFIFLYLYFFTFARNNNYYFYIIIFYVLFILSLFGFLYNNLFLITGLVWGDYSWGFSISLEFRFLLLCLYICYYGSIILCYIFSISKLNMLIIHFFFICLLLLVNFVAWIQFIPYISEFLSFLNLNNIRVELHQSEQSLHFFLLSISGYYVSLIFIYLIYFIVICIFSFFISFLHLFLVFNFFLKLWYFNNSKETNTYFIYLQYFI
jgi:hypothetical protein